MALDLNLEYSQRNDATAVIFRDNTGVYSGANTGGWGSPNTAVSALTYQTVTTAGRFHITMNISVTTPDGTTTAYDQIDLNNIYGAFTTPFDMVYTIDSTQIKASGVAIGSATDQVPDGIWDITYQVVNADVITTIVDTFTQSYLVTGVISEAVYDDLREVTEVYDFTDFDTVTYDIREVINPLYKYAYLLGAKSTNFSAKREEMVRKLSTLEGLTS